MAEVFRRYILRKCTLQSFFANNDRRTHVCYVRVSTIADKVYSHENETALVSVVCCEPCDSLQVIFDGSGDSDRTSHTAFPSPLQQTQTPPAKPASGTV